MIIITLTLLGRLIIIIVTYRRTGISLRAAGLETKVVIEITTEITETTIRGRTASAITRRIVIRIISLVIVTLIS
jgi:hypothetical protein